MVSHWHNELRLEPRTAHDHVQHDGRTAPRAHVPRQHHGRRHDELLHDVRSGAPDCTAKGLTTTLPQPPNGLRISRRKRAAYESVKIGTISRAKRSTACAC